jgi:hypothetical protein
MLVSPILVFYIGKHSQAYPKSLKHQKCVRMMYFRVFEKSHIFPGPRTFYGGHCTYNQSGEGQGGSLT